MEGILYCFMTFKGSFYSSSHHFNFLNRNFPVKVFKTVKRYLWGECFNNQWFSNTLITHRSLTITGTFSCNDVSLIYAMWNVIFLIDHNVIFHISHHINLLTSLQIKVPYYVIVLCETWLWQPVNTEHSDLFSVSMSVSDKIGLHSNIYVQTVSHW